jgi:hypothetical protein
MSRSHIKLECTGTQFHGLCAAMDLKLRKGSAAVKVEQPALAALIRDHQRLLARLRENGITTTEDA